MAKRQQSEVPTFINPVPKPKRGKPKDQPLAGLEDVRIPELDEVCGHISDVREELNSQRTQEKEHLQTALDLMREHKKKSWAAHGVELIRIPGAEKIRCRTSKEKATAETDDE